MEKHEQSADAARVTRRIRPWHVILLVVLVIALVGAGVLYRERAQVASLITSRNVGGTAQATNLHLSAGFRADIFYAGLGAPRFITFSPDGTLFVAERGKNSIVALPDPQHTGQAAQRIVVASGLDDPTSLAFYQGALYVGESSTITRFTIGANYQASDKKVLVSHLPVGGHATRTVLIGSDGYMYVSTGSSCNVCIETDPHRATVWQYHLDGSNGRVYARGLRNAVGLAINPWNKQIWVTNNGRDLLGDDTPPETVYALQDGGNYGWPRCHAGDIIDPDFGAAGDCNGVVKPLVKMQAHSAPLGLAFYNATQFPQQYHGLFVAFHGSWNRSVPTGYKVVFVPLDAKGQVAGPVQDFITGWLQNSDATGRPVGLVVGPDGALYVSDDKAGIIYRVTYKA